MRIPPPRGLFPMLLLTGAGIFSGCGKSYEDVRPDPSNLNFKDSGLQSKDLIEMTDKLAPDLLQIPEITQNPNRIVIVLKPVQNRLSAEPTRDLAIYGARLKVNLNRAARDRLLFVEQKADLEKIQGEELDNKGDPFEDASRSGAPSSSRYVPQYALTGEFYDMPNRTTTYYLCTFKLVNIRTGAQAWENSYEVKSLN